MNNPQSVFDPEVSKKLISLEFTTSSKIKKMLKYAGVAYYYESSILYGGLAYNKKVVENYTGDVVFTLPFLTLVLTSDKYVNLDRIYFLSQIDNPKEYFIDLLTRLSKLNSFA